MSGTTTTGAMFGYSVSLTRDGHLLAIGAPFANENGLSQSGRVETYRLMHDDTLVELGNGIDGEYISDWFGFSVAIADGILSVGAPCSSFFD